MSLTAFAVERFRGFKELTEIEVRPITLLFGYNSSGKSALLRLIPLLRDTIADGREPVFLGSPSQRNASFADLQCRLDPKPVISLELASGDARIRYDIRDLTDQRRQVLERVKNTSPGTEQLLEWTTVNNVYDWHRENGKTSVQLDTQGLAIRERAEGLLHWPVPGAEELATAEWIDAVRARVPRRRPFGPRPHGPLSPDGSDAPSVLAFAYIDESPVYETVRTFYRDHLGHDLIVEPIGDDFRLLVSPKSDPTVRVDLVDTGEGFGQVLSVAVALARAAHATAPTLLAVEQPELHLHPQLHEQLAKWMCRLVSHKRGPRMLAETHSENLLLAVLLAILEGDLSPDDLVVYWVYQLGSGQSVAERITFDERARPQGAWPPNVFQEDAALAARLNALRLDWHD